MWAKKPHSLINLAIRTSFFPKPVFILKLESAYSAGNFSNFNMRFVAFWRRDQFNQVDIKWRPWPVLYIIYTFTKNGSSLSSDIVSANSISVFKLKLECWLYTLFANTVHLGLCVSQFCYFCFVGHTLVSLWPACPDLCSNKLIDWLIDWLTARPDSIVGMNKWMTM